MKVLTIGRNQNNDVIIADPTVSDYHLQLVIYDNGEIKAIDLNSTNGTYVNGRKIQHEIYVKEDDVIYIGHSVLPLRPYFEKYSRNHPQNQAIPFDKPESVTKKTGFGTIALILSIVGAGCVIIPAIRILKWGILAFIGNASTLIIASIPINILAIVLAFVTDVKDYTDNDAAQIAQSIAGFFIILVIGFWIYIRFIDPNLLNPFA